MDKKLYKLMDWARVEAIVYSEEDNPHSFLGAHSVKGGMLFQTFWPGAERVVLCLETHDDLKKINMEKVDEEGFFAICVKDLLPNAFTYKFCVAKDARVFETEDPYRFACTIPQDEIERFNAGVNYNIYDFLGAHVRKIDGVEGTSFALWAPGAVRVSVVGDFNNWDGRIHQMRRVGNSGVFEIFIPGIKDGDVYKYELKLKGNLVSLKSDPYAFGMQLRPDNASVVRDISSYNWSDNAFVSKRADFNDKSKPMSVYELYLGSFMQSQNNNEYENYREIASKVAQYVKKMGYTHIEIMPIMEHPLDASWGYQIIGYYAPTSRFGTPDDFKYFIDYMHSNGIGVILDWAPAYFPKDAHGLECFDGTCLYEHQDPKLGVNPVWDTLVFNYGRREVSNYLIANALFWIKEYHADGIRLDALASMLYRDYGKRDGEWIANIYGGKENLEAIEFVKHLNSINEKMETGALIIAEESTAWPKVTGDLCDDGLGFDYKWNMGWTNDFLDFMRLDPLFRSGSYSELTFSMIYAYSEKFMLALSHDEVASGKGALISQMPGDRFNQFANLRAFYAYMYMHPGKKLTFMGQDIAEYDEWNENRSVKWELLNYHEHSQFNDFVRDLNTLYKENSQLYELDFSPDGFEWINNISANETIIVFLRKNHSGECLLVVCNFADISRDNYKIGVPFEGMYKEIFSTDSISFGGRGIVNPRVKASKKSECDTRENSIRIKVAPLSVSVFSCTPLEVYEKNTKIKRKTAKTSPKSSTKK